MRTYFYAALIVALGAGIIGLAVPILPVARPPASKPGVEQLLGIRLLNSTAGVQLELRRHLWGEYESFIRFEFAAHELGALFSDPAFQPLTRSRSPLQQVATARFGQLLMDRFVLQQRPAWWHPPNGASFVLAYRSPPGPDAGYAGPNMSWYIVDTSDPRRFVAYVFVVEF